MEPNLTPSRLDIGFLCETQLSRLYSRFSAGLSAVLSIMVEISTSPFVEDTSLILHNEGEKQATEKQFLSTM